MKLLQELLSLRESTGYSVGDKVQTLIGGKWLPAVITKPPHKETGNYGVRIKHGKKTINTVSSLEQLKPLQEADEHTGRNAAADAMEYAWYIVRVKDDKIGAGPYDTRMQAHNATERFQWYNGSDYDVSFGSVDDDDNFRDAPDDVPVPKGMK